MRFQFYFRSRCELRAQRPGRHVVCLGQCVPSPRGPSRPLGPPVCGRRGDCVAMAGPQAGARLVAWGQPLRLHDTTPPSGCRRRSRCRGAGAPPTRCDAETPRDSGPPSLRVAAAGSDAGWLRRSGFEARAVTHPGAAAPAAHPWLGLRHVTAAVLVDMPPQTRAATAWVEQYAPDEAAAHQALLNGIVYRHRDHHARTCACQTCVSRRAALRRAFPLAWEAAAALTGATVAADERYGPGVVFPEGGSTHVVCCTCSFCQAQRRAAGSEALSAAAADGVVQPTGWDPGFDSDAVRGGTLSSGARGGSGAGGARSRDKKKTTPRASDTAVVTVCADGGFVVGISQPHRHLHGCKCPNCNRFRVAMLGGVRVVRLTEAESRDVALAPAFSDFMAGDADAGVNGEVAPQFDPLVVKEAIRRARIGASNSGRLPWNAGRQHSQETKAKIAARTRAALLDPAVRARIGAVSRPHSTETKAAISVGIARYLARRRGAALAVLEETLRLAVETAIHIAARSLPGSTWWALPLALSDTITPPRPVSSRVTLGSLAAAVAGKKQSQVHELIEGPPLRNGATRKRPFRAKSEEHKQRLASAMRARWADPTYAGRTRENMRAAWFKRIQDEAGTIVALPRPAKPPAAKRPAKAAVVKAADIVVAAAGGGVDAPPTPVAAPKPRSRASKRELTAVQRESLATQAHAMLAQAEAAAEALEAAAAGGAPVDADTLAEVHAAVATAQDILTRVALAGASKRAGGRARAAAAAPVADEAPGAPAPQPVVQAAPAAEVQEEAPRAPPTKVWLRGRLVSADQAARAEQRGGA